MHISQILSTDRICCDTEAASKKAALETLAGLIAKDSVKLTQTEVFESLLARERLGSTGLGHGVALPHGRIDHDKETLGAFIQLRTAIDYDAIDKQPVDILFALLVPQESTDEHLQILSQLAEKFSDANLLDQLRTEKSEAAVYNLLTG